MRAGGVKILNAESGDEKCLHGPQQRGLRRDPKKDLSSRSADKEVSGWCV